ncbi:response regulator [Pseudomonas sp. NY15364]|uniref:response regulator n=1 Tax=Pseudomonas sp. NY15364 TaxID=3400353 RepID=UPI003A88170B
MLTAKGDESSRIQGLELGADDYLAKPFNPRELLARIKAVLRRQAPVVPGAPGSEDESVSFGEYELSLATRELKKGDELHMLTTGEFAVGAALAVGGALCRAGNGGHRVGLVAVAASTVRPRSYPAG